MDDAKVLARSGFVCSVAEDVRVVPFLSTRSGRPSARTVGVGLGSRVQSDLSLLGQLLYDLHLKISAVHARLAEGAGVAVLFPVVVPIALLVGPVTKHGHLWAGKKDGGKEENETARERKKQRKQQRWGRKKDAGRKSVRIARK